MSADLTPERLAEWRKEADYVRMSDDDPLLVERDDRILTLIDALRDARRERDALADWHPQSAVGALKMIAAERDLAVEKAAREEATRRYNRAEHERMEEKVRADRLQQELREARDKCCGNLDNPCPGWVGLVARAEKAERERDDVPTDRLCSQCGEQMAAMVKVGTVDGWCLSCLDDAADGGLRDLADLRAKVRALANEWNGIALDQHEIRFTVPSDSLRALLGGDQ